MNPECEGYKTVPGKRKSTWCARKSALKKYKRGKILRSEAWLPREEFIKQKNQSEVKNFADLALNTKIKIVRSNIQTFENQIPAPPSAETLTQLTEDAVNKLEKLSSRDKLNKYFKSYTKKDNVN